MECREKYITFRWGVRVLAEWKFSACRIATEKEISGIQRGSRGYFFSLPFYPKSQGILIFPHFPRSKARFRYSSSRRVQYAERALARNSHEILSPGCCAALEEGHATRAGKGGSRCAKRPGALCFRFHHALYGETPAKIYKIDPSDCYALRYARVYAQRIFTTDVIRRENFYDGVLLIERVPYCLVRLGNTDNVT